MQRKPFDDRATAQAAVLLAAMSNSKRLHILEVITQTEMSVRSLADTVGLSQSALSQHLGKLRGAKLVTTRRDAQTVYYSCSSPAVRLLLATLYEVFGPTHRQLPFETRIYS